MDVTVCMPWRGSEDRVAAYARVMAFWRHHGFTVICADSDPDQPFNVSQARNNAVAKATTTHVILADADTISDIASIHQALTTTDVVWPFTYYRRISADWVSRSDLFAAPVRQDYSSSPGGVIVCPRATYHRLGGFDEQFTGWGFEDNAFRLVAKTFATVSRLPGTVFAFDHAQRRVVKGNSNQVRWMTYRRAAFHREALARLAGVDS